MTLAELVLAAAAAGAGAGDGGGGGALGAGAATSGAAEGADAGAAAAAAAAEGSGARNEARQDRSTALHEALQQLLPPPPPGGAEQHQASSAAGTHQRASGAAEQQQRPPPPVPAPRQRHYYLRAVGANPRTEPARLEATFPQLAADLRLPLLYAPEAFFASVLRIASAGLALWTHYDVMDNVLVQITGSKRVLLFDPSDAVGLPAPPAPPSLMHSLNRSAPLPLDRRADLGRFPFPTGGL